VLDSNYVEKIDNSVAPIHIVSEAMAVPIHDVGSPLNLLRTDEVKGGGGVGQA